MNPELRPLSPLPAATTGPRFALSVDVEEWYHTCLVPAYVDPQRRPSGLTEELDWLLPDLLELLAASGSRATFFVLGEVAAHLPGRIREVAAAGHEICSHSQLHFRIAGQSRQELASSLRRSKALLEDLIGQEVRGFRAPEWSFREPRHPLLGLVADAGYRYDSSLAPVVGAGRWSNPRRPYLLQWTDRGSLLELPPLVFGGPLHLPAGSWPGRLAGTAPILAAARRAARRGELPVMVVHPWEVSGRPTPGPLRGMARFVHETGRGGYRERFGRLLAAVPWVPIGEAAAEWLAVAQPSASAAADPSAEHIGWLSDTVGAPTTEAELARALAERPGRP